MTYASGSQNRTTDIYGGNTLNLRIGNEAIVSANTNNISFGKNGLNTNINGTSTTINGSTINIGNSNTTSVNIGNTNNKVVINPMNLTISTANG